MSLFGKWCPFWLAAVFFVAAAGCSLDQGQMDDEKEPHYVLGKSRVNAMNYSGAIEAFEESLEVNPHSAQAHYQLAMLYENQESDPAAAIYHYQQFLKYDPKSENAEIIVQHIASCKQQLAADVLQLPSAPAAQQQLEKLTEENRRLHDQITQWQAYYAAQQAAAKTNAAIYQAVQAEQPRTSTTPDDITPQSNVGLSGAGNTSTPTPTSTPPNRNKSTTSKSTTTAPKNSRARTHVVQYGETMASIARKHGISLSSLQAANPSVSPKKLRAGQVLNLP